MFKPGMRRATASLVLITFSSFVLQPLSAVAQQPVQPSATAARPSASGEERFSQLLNEVHELLRETVPQAAMPEALRGGKPGEMDVRAIGPRLKLEIERAKPLPRADAGKRLAELRGKIKELLALEADVRKGFDVTARELKEKNLPAVILARHEEAVRAYEARSAEFKVLANGVERAATTGASPPVLQATLNDLGAFMAKYPNAKTHTPGDPNNLPWGSPKPVKRAPATTTEEFRKSAWYQELEQTRFASLLATKRVKVAQAGSLSGIALPATALPATPQPADLAETEDVQITPAVRSLATSLNNQPVAIYNWVRNNIQFIPSYGSIQGSDMTLQTKKGNAFDTASLLIALFRAANIPARYVYGTIDVPVDKTMNWVGGVTVAEAAMQLMGQGGIPNVGLARAGKVVDIRLEHVWVEAYVDYIPSRGAVHRQGDTWVPLDASFKQYQFTQGLDIKKHVPFDVQAFVKQIQAGATINQAEGWVQNVNQAPIQQTLTNYQNQVEAYVNAQKPKASVGEVLGTQTVIQDGTKILYGTLPYKTVVAGAKFQAIPDNLRWKFRYNVYANDTDRAADSPFISYIQNTSKLAGKKVTLSFTAASQADRDTINRFLPQPRPPGTPIQPSEFPQSLPGYLIRLVPEIRVEGQIVATGPAFTMGSEVIQNAAYLNAATGQWEQGEDNRPTVGDYVATALDLQGVNPQELLRLKERMDALRTKLNQLQQNPSDQSPIQNLSKEDLPGDLLYSAVVSYFGSIDSAARIAAGGAGMLTVRMPSFGNFAAAAKVLFFFGTPRTVGFPGLEMDIDRIVGADVAKDGSAAAVVAFRRSIGGLFSAHEHLIPERLFTDPNDVSRPEAVSAVKAITRAGLQGQRIYTLTTQNQGVHAQALSQLSIDAAVKQEIANALSAGKEVTVHQAAIDVSGFRGVGYIIVDPDTGAGAYKISGGANGALLILSILAIIVIMALVSIQFIALFGGYLIVSGIAGIAALIVSYLIPGLYDIDPLAASVAKLIGLVILTIGVGSLMGSIALAIAIRLLLPVILSWLFTLYELISKIFALRENRLFIARTSVLFVHRQV